MVVVLPAPLAPSRPINLAVLHLHRHVPDGGEGAERRVTVGGPMANTPSSEVALGMAARESGKRGPPAEWRGAVATKVFSSVGSSARMASMEISNLRLASCSICNSARPLGVPRP